jgi:hypothetical protein
VPSQTLSNQNDEKQENSKAKTPSLWAATPRPTYQQACWPIMMGKKNKLEKIKASPFINRLIKSVTNGLIFLQI